MSAKIIAISGGIGSGKSVVSKMLRIMGYEVYDCDAEARRIMDSNREIIEAVKRDICAEAVSEDGRLIRPRLAEAVFSDAQLLNRLNKLVHGHVRNDIAQWAKRSKAQIVFVETAILYESEIDRMVDEVWQVIAPREIRLLRAMRRDGADREKIMRRIESQERVCVAAPHKHVVEIVNDDCRALIPQVIENCRRRDKV